MRLQNHLFARLRSTLPLIFILYVAAFLRLFRIESLMRFVWDEGRDMLAIREIIVSRNLTLFGPFNEIHGRIDFFGVFHYYLMLPALWLADFHPVGPAIFTALLGVAAVGLSYFWCRAWLSRSQALIVAGSMAMSPLVVAFSRWPWNPNTTGFFGIVFLLALQQWSRRPSYLMAAMAGVFLGLLFQLHYFTISLAAAVMMTLVWKDGLRLTQKLAHGFFFVSGWILPNLSFVIFDLKHDGFYRKIILSSFNFSSTSQQLFEVHPAAILLGIPSYVVEVSGKFVGSQMLGYVLAAICVVWVVRNVHVFWQSKKVTESFQLTVAWIVFLFMTAFFPSLRDEYHSAALWVALPIAVVEVFSPWARTQSKKTLTTLLLVGSLFLIYANQPFRAPTIFENMPRVRAASMATADDARGRQGVNIASFVDADTRATRFRYFLVHEDVALLEYHSYPQTSVLYVISASSWEETRKNPAWELDTARELPAEQIWSDGDWRVYRVEIR